MKLDLDAPWPLPEMDPTKGVLLNITALVCKRDELRDYDHATVPSD